MFFPPRYYVVWTTSFYPKIEPLAPFFFNLHHYIDLTTCAIILIEGVYVANMSVASLARHNELIVEGVKSVMGGKILNI